MNKLSVIIPCYNEASTILDVVKKVKESPVQKIEIIVVDDASTDGTREILQKDIQTRVDKVIYHDRNRGKGAALRTGFKEATGDVVVVQDADLEYDPNEFPLLIAPIQAGKADVVYGSRFAGSGPHRVLYFWHMVGNRFLTLLSNMLTNLNLSDIETCYKMLKARLYENELQKRENEEQKNVSSKTDIGWGHQIRSYVLQPYQLVKDIRSKTESTNPEDVLNGNLDQFIEGNLFKT